MKLIREVLVIFIILSLVVNGQGFPPPPPPAPGGMGGAEDSDANQAIVPDTTPDPVADTAPAETNTLPKVTSITNTNTDTPAQQGALPQDAFPDPVDLPSAANPAQQNSQQCAEDWTCGSWGACTNGRETRRCFDRGACGTSAKKPDIVQVCEDDEPTAVEDDKSDEKEGTSFFTFFFWFIFLVGLGGAGYVLYMRMQNKVPDDSMVQIKNYVNYYRQQGYTDFQIKNELLQVGWQQGQVDEAMK